MKKCLFLVVFLTNILTQTTYAENNNTADIYKVQKDFCQGLSEDYINKTLLEISNSYMDTLSRTPKHDKCEAILINLSKPALSSTPHNSYTLVVSTFFPSDVPIAVFYDSGLASIALGVEHNRTTNKNRCEITAKALNYIQTEDFEGSPILKYSCVKGFK